MLQKIRSLPQSIRMIIVCVICLGFGVIIISLVKWLG